MICIFYILVFTMYYYLFIFQCNPLRRMYFQNHSIWFVIRFGSIFISSLVGYHTDSLISLTIIILTTFFSIAPMVGLRWNRQVKIVMGVPTGPYFNRRVGMGEQ